MKNEIEYLEYIGFTFVDSRYAWDGLLYDIKGYTIQHPPSYPCMVQVGESTRDRDGDLLYNVSIVPLVER